ncbi:hypothetical protein JXQ70_03950 [bacterium]|nr:hypothetical protein [bacterium]
MEGTEVVEKKIGQPQWDSLPKPSRLILSRKRVRDRKKPIQLTAPLALLLETLSLRNLKVIARNHELILGVHRKSDVILKIAEYLHQAEIIDILFAQLKAEERALVEELKGAGGCLPYPAIIRKYGSEDKDSPYWFLMPPTSILGRLRALGLVFIGEAFYNNWLQVVVCLPDEYMIQGSEGD